MCGTVNLSFHFLFFFSYLYLVSVFFVGEVSGGGVESKDKYLSVCVFCCCFLP